MTDVTLPTPESNPGKAEWSEVFANDKALREVVNGELDNSNLSGEAGITAANLAASAKPFTWYTPKVIATEESRTNATFGTLTTADEIKEVKLAENGLILVIYEALWKESSAGLGRAGIFLNETIVEKQTNSTPSEQFGVTDAANVGKFRYLGTAGGAGLKGDLASGAIDESPAPVTTGNLVGQGSVLGSGLPSLIEAAAGTYKISIRVKSSSGSVTMKNRKLWVATLG